MKSFSQFTDKVTVRNPKHVIRELTVSPHYKNKNGFNPFYVLDIDTDKDVKPTVGAGQILYKSVENPSGELIKKLGNGKYYFQVVVDGSDTPYYVQSTKSNVKSHFGSKSRKDSTASSNVNELLTVHFLIHPDQIQNQFDFEKWVAGQSGGTGVLAGSGKEVTYEDIVMLLDKDETSLRDILIGMNNAKAVAQDLKGRTIKNVYWVPRGKPAGIGGKNPSDVIVQTADGYQGYSNKISGGADATPKINTNIVAFYSKVGDKGQVGRIQSMIDNAWNTAGSMIDPKRKNAYKAINSFNIKKEKFSESASQRAFATIAKEFAKDGLDFYTTDMYWPFRNTLLEDFSKYVSSPKNLLYFLNTMGYYTYDDPNATPCPYKLLIGSEKGSTIKEVSGDDSTRQMLMSDNTRDFSGIKTSYDGKQQTFKLSWTYKPLKISAEMPVVLRTRQAGGWAGKSLYITSSGIK
tara:strand:- start:40 stop:1425 length:1386 start_codon:yes stop_codon:yes gene_type:complete